MHDHRTRGKRFCPLMGEWCTKGWTPKMGNGPDGFPIEGACAAWQPVSSFDKEKNQVIEIFDCSQFGWVPDLLSEVAQEMSHTTASTDKVATQIKRSREEFIGALPAEAHDRLATNEPKLLENPPE